MPKIVMSGEEAQAFLEGAKAGKDVRPPRTEYTPKEAGQLLQKHGATGPREPIKQDPDFPISAYQPKTQGEYNAWAAKGRAMDSGIDSKRASQRTEKLMGAINPDGVNVDNSGLTKEKLP